MQRVHATLSAAVVALVVWLSPSTAHAGKGATWAVAVTGDACQDDRAALEHEITLACEAVGNTCGVAPAGEAELHAVLSCAGDAPTWTLETSTSSGAVIDRIDLSGPRDDRLREAAVEVARDAAPERSLAVETLRATIPDAVAPSKPEPEQLLLGLGARATGSSSGDPAAGGAHLVLAYALGRIPHATIGVAGEVGGTEKHATRAARAGIGLAFGAPFAASSPFGFAFEVGAGTRQRSEAIGIVQDGSGTAQIGTRSAGAAYAQTALVVQWPRGGIRPYASLVGALTTETDARFFGSGEAGLVFPLY